MFQIGVNFGGKTHNRPGWCTKASQRYEEWKGSRNSLKIFFNQQKRGPDDPQFVDGEFFPPNGEMISGLYDEDQRGRFADT